MTSIADRYSEIRGQTGYLVSELNPEDTVVQPVVDVSPPKWHLAHTTWFFENFILKNYIAGLKPFHPDYDFLFNSYYQSQGTRVQRNMRGSHPRPLFSEILEYRKHVDEKLLDVLEKNRDDSKLAELVELGLNHEQQHQELLLTDLKYIWGFSPLHPVFKPAPGQQDQQSVPLKWLKVDGGIYNIGHLGQGFCFDNEAPDHEVRLYPFEIASRPVTNGEFLEFIADKGYEQWQYWLHEGWHWRTENEINAPMYWKKQGDEWFMYTLNGLQQVNKSKTLTHVSFYEAEAFARWKGLRLPTEEEWEVAAGRFGEKDISENFLENQNFHPTTVKGNDTAFRGQVWEWTNSAYLPYPGFKPWEGAIGEYNGKFMINQMVLRGGSCVTPEDHIRLSYRNFFHPHLRWQFTGIRLAKNN